jgi:hypothetical protein
MYIIRYRGMCMCKLVRVRIVTVLRIYNDVFNYSKKIQNADKTNLILPEILYIFINNSNMV